MEPDEAVVASSAGAMLEGDHASRALGIEVLRASEGDAVARMLLTEPMVNGHSMAHGGYVFLLADTAFACACNSHGPVTVAASAEVTFVAPAYEGDLLHAYAAERTRFGRSGIYDVTVRRGGEENDVVVAEFRGHSKILKRGEDARS